MNGAHWKVLCEVPSSSRRQRSALPLGKLSAASRFGARGNLCPGAEQVSEGGAASSKCTLLISARLSLRSRRRPRSLVVANQFHELLQAWPRLSEILLKTTWQQTELEVEEDLAVLREWAQQFDLFSKQQAHPPLIYIYLNYRVIYNFSARVQGALDFKYLSDRYNRGAEKVQGLMEDRLHLVAHPTLVQGHSRIVQKQAALGPKAHLASLLTHFLPIWG